LRITANLGDAAGVLCPNAEAEATPSSSAALCTNVTDRLHGLAVANLDLLDDPNNPLTLLRALGRTMRG
jgi:hypothetical protein